MVLPGFDVRLRHRDRLTEASAPLRGDDDHAGARRPFQDERPLLRRETGLSGHLPISPLPRRIEARRAPCLPARSKYEGILRAAVAISVGERRARFRELHAREQLFVMPNPWDVGSARLLAS